MKITEQQLFLNSSKQIIEYLCSRIDKDNFTFEIQDIKNFSSYLNLTLQLICEPENKLFKPLSSLLKLPTSSTNSPSYSLIIYYIYILYEYIEGGGRLKEVLKDRWLWIQIAKNRTKYTHIPMEDYLELIQDYTKGRKDGIYKDIQSFQKVIQYSQIDLELFRKIMRMVDGLISKPPTILR